MKPNKYLTFSFDDCEIYDRRLCEMLRKHNMKATFFLISDQLGFRCNFHRYGEDTVVQRVFPEELKETYREMEIATHTANHRCPEDDLENTVLKSAEYLEGLCDNTVCGLAYPGGVYSDEHIKRLKGTRIVYARTTDVTHNFNIPTEWLAWHPTCKYDDPEINRLAEEFLNYKGEKPVLFHIYGHSCELTRKQEGCNWESFEKLLQKLANKKDILYVTNIMAKELCSG